MTSTTAAAITLADVESYIWAGPRPVDINSTLYEGQLYLVPSRSHPDTPNEPVLLPSGVVICTCRGFLYRDHCRHCDELPVVAAYRWWRNVLADADAATLRDVAADKGGLIRCGYDVADSRGCELAVESLLRGMGEWGEEAA